MTNELTTTTWAEAGDWGQGSAVVIMRGTFDLAQLVDPAEVIADIPVSDWHDDDAVQDVLSEHGYRERRECRSATDYGIVLTIEV